MLQGGGASWRKLLRAPNIAAYLVSYASDTLGDLLWFVTLSWVVTGNARLAAAILFLAGVPALLLMPLGGALVGRVGVARVAMVTLSIRTFVMLVWAAAIVYSWGPPTLVLPILGVLLGCIDGLHRPAVEAWPVAIARAERIKGAQTTLSGMERFVGRLCQFAAGLIGGYLIHAGGVGTPALVASGLFILSLGLFRYISLRVRAPLPDRTVQIRGSVKKELSELLLASREGRRVIRSHPVLSRVLPAQGAYNALTNGLTLAAIPLKSHAAGWGVSGFGWTFSAWGVGLFVGNVFVFNLLDRTGHKVRVGVTLTAVVGVLVIAFGLMQSLPLAAATMLLAGVASGPVGPALSGYFKEFSASREHDQGALTGIQTMALDGMEPVGLLVVGGLVALFGAAVGCSIVGLGMIVTAAWAIRPEAVKVATS